MPHHTGRSRLVALAGLALLIASQPGCSSTSGAPHDHTTTVVAELTRRRNVALLSGRTRMTGREGGAPFTTHYRYIDAYVRTNGTWKVCSVQTTRLPR